ncbi:MAG: DUF305 domain-containing protein [Acidimicrobiia bacterium]
MRTITESVDATDSDDEETGPRAGRGLSVLLLVVSLVFAGGIGWRIGRAQGEPTVPEHSSVEVGFFQDMSTHHNQAVGMAMTYLANGTAPLLRQIAGEIVTYQSSEIGVMGEYLTRWHEAGTEGSTAMGWMGMRTPRNQMTGMATKPELAALNGARGPDLDQLFTRLMIDHHVGGIHMAEYAAKHATMPEVKRWALSMADGQRGEIAELNQWRVRNGFPPDRVNLSG